MFEKYPYRCRIFMVTGNSYIERPDQGRHAVDKNTKETKFIFKKSKLKIPAIQNEFIVPSTFGKTIYFIQKSPQEIEPITFEQLFPKEKLPAEVNYQKLTWLAQENKYAAMRWRKPSAWQALLPILPVAIAGIVSVLMLVIFMTNFGTLVDKATPAINNLAVAENNFAIAENRFAIAMDNFALIIKQIYPGINITFIDPNMTAFINFTGT